MGVGAPWVRPVRAHQGLHRASGCDLPEIRSWPKELPLQSIRPKEARYRCLMDVNIDLDVDVGTYIYIYIERETI